jgi:hypothetical protein
LTSHLNLLPSAWLNLSKFPWCPQRLPYLQKPLLLDYSKIKALFLFIPTEFFPINLNCVADLIDTQYQQLLSKVFVSLNLIHSITTNMVTALILETWTDCHRFVCSLDAGLADKDYTTTLSFLRHLSLL